MRRTVSWIFILGVTLCGSVAEGGWSEFWHRMKVDYHRNACWPQPFQAADRELTRGPLIAMTASGWRENNTLSDHFFHGDDQSINQAGELKLRWIVTQAPGHRRTVYVLRGATPDETTARVAAVHRTIQMFVIDGPRPDVIITDKIPVGASGDYFDQVDRQLKQSIPAPRLPPMDSPTGGN